VASDSPTAFLCGLFALALRLSSPGGLGVGSDDLSGLPTLLMFVLLGALLPHPDSAAAISNIEKVIRIFIC
jgi:hypothetical protein